MQTTNQFELFQYSMLIREHHLDTFGHVNNATYLEMLEEARWEFINARGFGMKHIQQIGLGPTILEWHIKFLKEIRLRQTITIVSQTLSYEKKIGLLRQDILNAENELCSRAEMTFGLFDTKERKLVLPTPEWLYAVGLSQTNDLP
jgi:acyl-CoA thioester hydrolase